MSNPQPVISIQLERTSAIYSPGEAVEGTAKFQIFANKRIRAVKLEITGKFEVKWRYRDLLNNHNKTYFQQQLYLCGRPGGDPYEVTVGEYVFPFKFQLPNNIPSSYDMTYARVQYTIEGIIDESWSKQQKRQRIFVVETPLLFSRDLLMRPVELTKNKNFYCFPMCLPRGKASVRYYVPKSAYYVGETIEASVDINMRSDTVSALKVTMQLHLKTICRPLIRNKRYCEEEIIKETHQEGPFASNTVLISMEIPETPPSYVVDYEKIEVQYKIILIVNVSGCHLSVTQEIPILIGSKRMQTLPATNLPPTPLPSMTLPPIPLSYEPILQSPNVETTNPHAQLLNPTA